MLKMFLKISFLAFPCILFAQNQSLQTFFEKSDYLETPRYSETIDFCKKLTQASSMVHYSNFGISPQGRELPLVIVDQHKNFSPESVAKSGNVVMMIQAGIHAGEPDGKDAGLMLIRDIITKKEMQNLLDHVTILFIPIFNVDGHERFGPYNRINQDGPKEMGWRTTATNLNLNRDYGKADAPEMKAWIKLFNNWSPDFLADCHTTDGAHYQYIITYSSEIFGNMEKDMTDWTRDVYLKTITENLEKKKIPNFPYIEFRDWSDPSSGMEAFVSPCMLSQGYAALRNRPGLLIETHMLKDYRTRVLGTYQTLLETLLLLNKEFATLRRLNKNADAYIGSKEFRDKELPLDFETLKDSTLVEFKGFEYERVKSELTGGDWIKYSKIPKTYSIAYFDKLKGISFTKLPEAYILPPEWSEVIQRLDIHGIKYFTLGKSATLTINSYKFRDVKLRESSFEGRQLLRKLNFDEITEQRTYPSGSVVIEMNQATAKLIAYLFEPASSDAFVNWGFFNAIFEQKEYSESYVMEVMAREMLAKDENLRIAFEKKKAEDKDFANNSYAILNWFYSKTPYWDNHLNMYPVGKILDSKILDNLK